MIILVRDENVSNILDRMIKLFTVRESFEICAKLSTIKNGWTEFITNFKEEDNKKPVIEKKQEILMCKRCMTPFLIQEQKFCHECGMKIEYPPKQ